MRVFGEDFLFEGEGWDGGWWVVGSAIGQVVFVRMVGGGMGRWRCCVVDGGHGRRVWRG